MSEPQERPAERVLASLTAGGVIGVIEVVLASSFAALIFGVALGLVLAVVLFAVSYSRTDLVRQTVSGSVLRSNADRPPAEREALRVLGERVHILQLQGFVFFGTASSLLERIRERASDAGEPPMRYLVLDFRRVSGVDSSAVLSFRKAVQLARAQGFELVLTAVPAQVRRQGRGARERGARDLPAGSGPRLAAVRRRAPRRPVGGCRGRHGGRVPTGYAEGGLKRRSSSRSEPPDTPRARTTPIPFA